ncbi:MAG TPA: hypothetical protein VMY37_19715 [Thermoguttaceae bacterium]|nr:hypothetical protein [Thermoguttaceae bacterium]
MGGSRKGKSDKDSSVYGLVNDVHGFARDRMAVSDIADELGLTVDEVEWILRAPLDYDRKHGVEAKAPSLPNDMPIPAAIAEVRRRRLVGLRGILAAGGIGRFYEAQRREQFNMEDCFTRRHRKYEDGKYPHFAEFVPNVISRGPRRRCGY